MRNERRVPSHVLRKRYASFLAGRGVDTASASYAANAAQVVARIRAEEARERDEEAVLRRAMAAGPVAFVESGRQLLELLARRHGVRWRYEGHRRPHEGACRGQWLLLPPPTCEDSLATFSHELAHALHPCAQTGAHLPVVYHGTCRRCLACEVTASTEALRLLPPTPAMGRALEASLRTYRKTPSPVAATTQAARYAASWRARLQAHVAQELRMEKVADMQRWAEEVRQR